MRYPMRRESHNLDGRGWKQRQVYVLPVHTIHQEAITWGGGAQQAAMNYADYWPAVTDVPCPGCESGIIRWAENGYVPGYRICDGCGRHYLARGNASEPTLINVGRRGGPLATQIKRARNLRV